MKTSYENFSALRLCREHRADRALISGAGMWTTSSCHKIETARRADAIRAMRDRSAIEVRSLGNVRALIAAVNRAAGDRERAKPRRSSNRLDPVDDKKRSEVEC
jgi:hypothetical protein